jgi:hypothetical protein
MKFFILGISLFWNVYLNAQQKSDCNFIVDSFLLIEVDIRSLNSNPLFLSGLGKTFAPEQLNLLSEELFIKSLFQQLNYVPDLYQSRIALKKNCSSYSKSIDTNENTDLIISKHNSFFKRNSASLELKLTGNKIAYISISRLSGTFYKSDTDSKIIIPNSNCISPSEIPYVGEVFLPYKISSYKKAIKESGVFK